MSLNLKQKSFVFVALSVLLLLVVYVGLSNSYLNSSRNRYLGDLRQNNETAAKNLDDFFRRAATRLDTIANLPLLRNGLQSIAREIQPASDTLHYLVWKSDIFSNAYLLNEQGDIIWSEPPQQEIVDTPYPAFAQVKETFKDEAPGGQSFMVLEEPKGQNQILLSSTLVNQDGTLEGYLIGAIPTDHEAIQAALVAKGASSVQLVTNDGVVVNSSTPARVMRQLPYPDAALAQMKKERSGVVAPTNIPALRSIVAYKTLESAPWMLTTDEDEVSAFHDTNSLRLTLTAIGFLSVVIVMTTLIFVVRGFTRPVEALTEEARRIAAGDMEARFSSNRSDEIGVLAKTLEDMKLRLRSSYDRLLQSEKMSLMGQVVAGIAHELNNPLTIVIGHTELMLMKGISEQYKLPLTRIHDGAERAAKIVKNLLTFARQQKPERKVSDINTIVTKTLDLRAYELKVSNVELVTELAPYLPPTLCDPHQLQQVFLNLIVNAEQAMLDANGKGRLTVRTSQKDDVIYLRVEDNGPGISMDNLRRVFDPFFTTKPVGKGTGLGLAICQGIVAEHGGHLTVESSLGFGATFTMELPIINQSAEREAPVANAAAQTTPRPRRILVVDDEGHMRDLFTDILHADGHAVVTAENGRIALQLIEKNQFDLLITDIKMPDVDGPAFFEGLKKQHSTLATHVLFVTGDLMNASTLRFLENCGNPWIAKPFEISVVRETVRRMLSS